MTPEEREQMYALCARIVEEKDPDTFIELVKELNELLDRKEDRLVPTRKKLWSNTEFHRFRPICRLWEIPTKALVDSEDSMEERIKLLCADLIAATDDMSAEIIAEELREAISGYLKETHQRINEIRSVFLVTLS
jgi:predicted GNAT family acetyltransferase